MNIASIEPRRYRYPLDPPFLAAWDPEPRTSQEATIVVVRADDGTEGYASGDAVHKAFRKSRVSAQGR